MGDPYEEEMENEVPEVSPSEALENMVDELIAFAKDSDEHMTAEWIPEEALYRITSDELDPVDVMIVDIDDAMYGEAEAIVVESEIGPMGPDADAMELLRFCDQDLLFSRLSLVPGDYDDEELLIMQAACPISQLSAAQFDAMVREVAVYSQELREGSLEEDEEAEDAE